MARLVYKGTPCVSDTPIGRIVWNDKTSQTKLKYGLKRGFKLAGEIQEEVIEIIQESGEGE